MTAIPTGTVTFLFTDIEGSTKLAQEYPDAWEAARARHHAILQAAITEHGGFVFQIVGDSFCAAFGSAPEAVLAATESQRGLQAEGWAHKPVRVRMGLHTGVAEARAGNYIGYLTLARVQRVMSAAHGGQILVSAATAGLLQGQMPDGISLRNLGEQRLKGLLNPEHLWQVVVPGLPQDFPPLSSLDATPNNLPSQLTSFVGREHELAEVQRLIGNTALLTVTGSGGMGKTRLALQAACGLLERFPDGVWFVELASLNDPQLVSQAVAATLGLREEPGQPLLTTLTRYVREKCLLLILDNCEHLIEACARLADGILHAAPQARILCTSREALSIAGESMYLLPPLPSADANDSPAAGDAAPASVQLFAERATALRPDFMLTAANTRVVAQICRRLDGIPLAIELAAARIKLFTVEQIAAHLDDRFRLLTGGSRTALARQQTLRATMDWSYGLLSDSERMLFRRLSVFAGGWSFEAMEAVCDGEPLQREQLLDLLTRLVDKSLVITEGDTTSAMAAPAVRYRMLETIREYARDALIRLDESEEVRARHLNTFRRLSAQTEYNLERAGQLAWLNRLDSEIENLRAAFEWSLNRQLTEDALHLAADLSYYWLRRGYLSEGRDWLVRSLSGEVSAYPYAHARALSLLSRMERLLGLFADARSHLESALSLLQESEYPSDFARALARLGEISGDEGRYAEARSLFERSLVIQRRLDDKPALAHLFTVLGEIARAQGDYVRAGVYYADGLALATALGNDYRRAILLHNLGYVKARQGALQAAEADIRESVLLSVAVGDKWQIAHSLVALAGVAGRQGQAARSARLFGAGDALFAAIGSQPDFADRVEYERDLAVAQTLLDPAAFAAARAEGRALTMAQAVALALANPGMAMPHDSAL